MTERYQRLRQYSGKLNAASSELTGYCQALNACLKSLNVGVEAWVPISQSSELGYVRFDKTWQLCVTDHGEVVKLVDAKRRLRAAAVGHFENLLIEMERQCELVLSELLEASILAAQLMEGVNRAMSEMDEEARRRG